jgi:hypothetical protein
MALQFNGFQRFEIPREALQIGDSNDNLINMSRNSRPVSISERLKSNRAAELQLKGKPLRHSIETSSKAHFTDTKKQLNPGAIQKSESSNSHFSARTFQ